MKQIANTLCTLLALTTLLQGAPAELLQEAEAKAAAKEHVAAAKLYRNVAAATEATAADKVKALNRLAALQAGPLTEIEAAAATYDELAALEGATPQERLAARNNKAQMLSRQRGHNHIRAGRDTWAAIGNDTTLAVNARLSAWLRLASHATVSSLLRDLDAARSAVASALALEGLTGHQQAQVLLQAIETETRGANYSQAAAHARRIIAIPDARLRQQVEARHHLAQALLELGEAQAAEESVRQALTIEGLKPFETSLAWENIGRISVSLKRQAAAREAFLTALQYEPERPNAGDIRRRDRLVDAVIKTYEEEQAYQAAIDFCLSRGLHGQAARVISASGEHAKAYDFALAAAKDEQLDDAARWGAMVQYIAMCNSDYKYAALAREAGLVAQLGAAAPERYKTLLAILRSAMMRAVYPAAAQFAALTIQADKLNPTEFFQVHLYRVNALAGSGQQATAASEAAKFATLERLPPPQRFYFALVAQLLQGADEAAAVAKIVAQVQQQFGFASLADEELQDAMLRAGRSAMIAQRYETAKGVSASYDALFIHPPQKEYTVAYMQQAPHAIDSFLASEIIKNAAQRATFDRKFGGDLETVAASDVSTGDRGDISIVAGAGDTETHFYAVCDSDGIHIFFDAKDDRAADVAAGTLRGGSFEGYIAAGERAPHTCFLVNLQTGVVRLWNSAYPTEQHCWIKEDQPGFRSEFRHTDEAHLLYLFFDWELFFDKLPENDDIWLFEPARWARGGRVTWNGLKTVHGRSSFGHWRFALDEAARLAIKRKLIYKGYARYQQEKVARENGLLSFYSDPDYSDPVFHEAAVAPLVARLDGYGKRLSATMSEADINDLFDNAVNDWFNIRYRVAELRRHWLAEQFTAAP